MRLFTAIDLPPDVLLRLERLLAALRPEANVNWSPVDNLHITTKFIGDWPESRLPEIDRALQTITALQPFTLSLENLGWFPNERSARVLWAGVKECSSLTLLANETETALEGLGISKEARPYSPHLTLARIRQPVALDSLKRKLRAMQPLCIGSCPVTRFVLYQSRPGSNASLYVKLHEYSLSASLAAAATM